MSSSHEVSRVEGCESLTSSNLAIFHSPAPRRRTRSWPCQAKTPIFLPGSELCQGLQVVEVAELQGQPAAPCLACHRWSASTTEVSIWRSETDQYVRSSRSFSSRETIWKPCRW